ncbi:MAG: hypothetical protein R3F61_17800 [Myxococcota bacterium]
MSNNQVVFQPPSEVRIIEHGDGFVCATFDPVDTARVTPGPLMVTFMVLVACTMVGLPLLLWWAARTPNCSWWRLRCTQHGIKVDHVFTRTLRQVPSVSHVRDDDLPPYVAPPANPERFFAFSEITAMGCTDYSLWIETGGERHELMMEQTPRLEIQRIHDVYSGVWKRAVAAMPDRQAADRARAQLAAVTGQGS